MDMSTLTTYIIWAYLRHCLLSYMDLIWTHTVTTYLIWTCLQLIWTCLQGVHTLYGTVTIYLIWTCLQWLPTYLTVYSEYIPYMDMCTVSTYLIWAYLQWLPTLYGHVYSDYLPYMDMSTVTTYLMWTCVYTTYLIMDMSGFYLKNSYWGKNRECKISLGEKLGRLPFSVVLWKKNLGGGGGGSFPPPPSSPSK